MKPYPGLMRARTGSRRVCCLWRGFRDRPVTLQEQMCVCDLPGKTETTLWDWSGGREKPVSC